VLRRSIGGRRVGNQKSELLKKEGGVIFFKDLKKISYKKRDKIPHVKIKITKNDLADSDKVKLILKKSRICFKNISSSSFSIAFERLSKTRNQGNSARIKKNLPRQ
jgi:hypothetical protein